MARYHKCYMLHTLDRSCANVREDSSGFDWAELGAKLRSMETAVCTHLNDFFGGERVGHQYPYCP